MANADRPNGLKPVGTLSGSSWQGKVRQYESDGSEAIFIGDAVTLGAGGQVVPANAAQDIFGVVVGVIPTGNGQADNFLTNGNLDETEHPGFAPATAGIRVLVAVGSDILYEIQDDASGSAGATRTDYIGGTGDLLATNGSTTTGQSAHELVRSTLDTAATAQLQVVGIKDSPDNDPLLDNARWIVRINEAFLVDNSAGTA